MKIRQTVPGCAFAIVLLGSCGTESVVPAPVGPTRSGTSRLLSLSGTVLRLGSPEASPAPEEGPGWTRFEHDAWLDTTEVTQSEYAALLGRNPSTVRGDRLPVTNVSWFDAVLAANARSRRDGLDTVYEYVSVRSDSAGDVGDLPGLTIHLDRAGWRLPTEAEWEAAARAGTSTPWPWGGLSDSSQADLRAWYQRNASGRLHEVATKQPNAWGLYDLVGNAMEWVNDWKGPFPQDTMAEFAGQDVPGDVPDVPLKGGAYAYGLSHLRPSTRSATYAAYRSSRAEYVGFRLARGAFSPRFRGSTGDEVYTPPVTLVRSEVARLVGAWEARLVFVNRANGKGTLTWIDYGESNPVARGLPDSLPVFHPVISPDGRWVAWSTALEGSTGPSRIRARRLARNDTVVLDLGEGSIPRWWTSGPDTFLVRASALDNTTPGWSGTSTTARRWSHGTLSGSEEVWAPSGSYHDGRSGPFLVTGYRRLRQYDTRTGTDRILFTGPSNGKGAGDTSQVCNVSASPDGSGRSLFLDFGYSGTSTVVGRPYGIHEMAFVSDSAGRIVGQIPAPASERQWEHLEWSNASRWAVSGSIDGTGAYRNLYLVDLDSGKASRIVSGQELWQPGLWLGRVAAPAVPGAADPDSAGRYFEPEANAQMAGFGESLLRFWIRKDSAEVVLLGSSQFNGLLQQHFPRHAIANLSMAASTYPDWDKTLRMIVLPHASKVKVVAMTLMPGWLFRNGGWPGPQWETSVAPTIGIRYDAAHAFWSGGFLPGFFEVARARLDARGAVLVPTSGDYAGPGWGGSAPELTTSSLEDTTSAEFRENMSILRGMTALLAGRGIHLVLVNCPQSPAYRTTPAAGRYGPSWSMYHVVLERLRAMESANPFFHLYDAHQDGNHDYADDEAANWDHLSIRGADRLGGRLDSLVSNLLETH